MATIPLDTSVEAEFEDGFILSEAELEDISPYDEGANIFHAILNKRAEAEHGQMVRFSCYWKNKRYDIDWTELPDNARPIRFRHGFSTLHVELGVIESGFTGADFGVQWNEEDGKNHQEVIELR